MAERIIVLETALIAGWESENMEIAEENPSPMMKRHASEIAWSSVWNTDGDAPRENDASLIIIPSL